jgi:hypothetical protein
MLGKDATYLETLRRQEELKPRPGYRRTRLRQFAENFSLMVWHGFCVASRTSEGEEMPGCFFRKKGSTPGAWSCA